MKKFAYIAVSIAVTVTVVGFVVLDSASRHENGSFEIIVKNNMKQLVLALVIYTDDNEGVLPVSLYELEAYGFEGKIPKFSLPHSDWQFDWLYFRRDRITQLHKPQDYIILATPTYWNQSIDPPKDLFGGARIVAYPDGSVEKIAEVEFWKKVKTQQSGVSPGGASQ